MSMHDIMDREGVIKLSVENYKELFYDAMLLSFLQKWGVDNWSGYDEARREYNEWIEDDNEDSSTD